VVFGTIGPAEKELELLCFYGLSSCPGEFGLGDQGAEDLACDVALEAADDLLLSPDPPIGIGPNR
jgi:hypothetical protein